MNKSCCVRCVVQLQLGQMDWKDERGVNVNLPGAPVFIRGCVLGQMHHSHLQKPYFPVSFNERLTFDRIYTNCRNPSVFSEVIRGEHVKIELIQITPDYSGGKVLAKYESPAHTFLYPPDEGDSRTVLLSRTKRFKNPPELHFSCTTVLLEAMVRSPVQLIYGQSSSDSGQTDEKRKPSASRRLFPVSSKQDQRRQPDTSSQDQRRQADTLSQDQRREPGVSSPFQPSYVRDMSKDHRVQQTQAKLNSLLQSISRSKDEEDERRRRNKITFRTPSGQHRRHRSADSFGVYYTSPGQDKGLHDWPECPRRSSRSAPSSPPSYPNKVKVTSSPFHKHCAPLSNTVPLETFTSLQRLEKMDPALMPINKTGNISSNLSRPPFLIRRTDENLLKKRNFCGERLTKPQNVSANVVKHSVLPPKLKEREREIARELADQQREPRREPEWDEHGRRVQSKLKRHGSVPFRHQSPFRLTSPRRRSTSSDLDEGSDSRDDNLGGPSPVSDARRFPILRVPQTPSPSPCLRSPSPAPSPYATVRMARSPQDPVAQKEKEQLLNKYLLPANTKASPRSQSREKHPRDYNHLANVIEQKIAKLRRECCACLAASMNEDCLSYDLDHLRDTLQEQREEAMDRSSRAIPDQNVTIQIGPRDYWSKRMSEMTGKKHRVLFDETLRKIYNKLYTDASLTP